MILNQSLQRLFMRGDVIKDCIGQLGGKYILNFFTVIVTNKEKGMSGLEILLIDTFYLINWETNDKYLYHMVLRPVEICIRIFILMSD